MALSKSRIPKYASYPAELSRVSISCIYNLKERGRGIANIRRIFLEPELSGVYRLLERVGGSPTRVASCRAF